MGTRAAFLFQPAYLGFWGMIGGNLYDFHEVAIAALRRGLDLGMTVVDTAEATLGDTAAGGDALSLVGLAREVVLESELSPDAVAEAVNAAVSGRVARTQSRRESPSVTVRTSRCSISVIRTVCKISACEYSIERFLPLT